MKKEISLERLEELIHEASELSELIAYDHPKKKKAVKKIEKKMEKCGVKSLLEKGVDEL